MKFLFIFIALTLGEVLAMGLVFGLPNQKLLGTNEPFPGVFICADGDPTDGTHWVVYYWIAIVIVEFTLLVLALFKAWQHRASKGGSALMRELTQDSMIYFIIIFWIYIANTVLWFVNRFTLDELGTSFAFVVSSIFANRLLISVRSAYFKDDETSAIQFPSASIHFAKVDSERAATRLDTMIIEGDTTFEMTTFNERIGV